MNAQDITNALGGRWHGEYGMIRCPLPNHGNANGDPKPSLKVADRDDGSGVTVYCFAGCPWEAVKDNLRDQGLGSAAITKK